MNKLIPLMALALVVLFGCAKENPAELTQANDTVINGEAGLRGNNPKERPFSGTLVFDEDGDFEDCLTCPYVPYAPPFGDFRKFLGHGNLTHLGNSTAESMPCYTYIFNEDFDVIGFTIHEQCNTYIAANGDEVYSSTNEYDSYYNPACNCFYGEATGDFAGGTGRFLNASGSSTAQVSQDANTGVTTAIIDGVIVY